MENMLELGYKEATKVCLTHSYNTQNMEDDSACEQKKPTRGDKSVIFLYNWNKKYAMIESVEVKTQ